MGILYIVATPIGNLGDITLRALETLKEVDLILCEDTRVTQKLLAHYRIAKPLVSYHQHSKADKMQEIFDMLARGKNLALVTDAGTPGISDPGNELVAFLLAHVDRSTMGINSTQIKQLLDLGTPRIVPIPGPSSLTALASVAGIPMDKFLFLGYPPHKKGRKKFFEEIVQSAHPVIFYESPYRILKSLSELSSILNAKRSTLNPYVVVGRELTKKFETIYRGTIQEILSRFKQEKPRGEFVVLVSK